MLPRNEGEEDVPEHRRLFTKSTELLFKAMAVTGRPVVHLNWICHRSTIPGRKDASHYWKRWPVRLHSDEQRPNLSQDRSGRTFRSNSQGRAERVPTGRCAATPPASGASPGVDRRGGSARGPRRRMAGSISSLPHPLPAVTSDSSQRSPSGSSGAGPETVRGPAGQGCQACAWLVMYSSRAIRTSSDTDMPACQRRVRWACGRRPGTRPRGSWGRRCRSAMAGHPWRRWPGLPR